MWQDILKTAIVGTERNALALSARGDALGDVLSKLDANAREASLLSAAAAVALYERAGQLLAEDHQALPVPAETNDLPCCNARAAQHLSLLLSGEFDEVLPEWFAALIAAKRRILDEQLPAVLQLGKARAPLREAIVASIGQRGLWLAQQNADWSYVAGAVDVSEWHTATHVARLALLKRVRATQPHEARALLTAIWNEDSPKDRAEFLATFHLNLSDDDEAFLEAALDDRSTLIRRTAADLLSELPTSAFVQRMIAHAQPLFAFQKTRGKFEIEITLPSERTEAMIRDGITAKKLNVGEKTWWLQQMVRAIPVSFWEQVSGWHVKDIISASKKSEWKDVLLECWLESAWRQNRVDWVKAIFSIAPLKHRLPTKFTDIRNQQKLEAIIIDLLTETPHLNGKHQAPWLLSSYAQQWDEPLSTLVMRLLPPQLSDKFLAHEWYFLGRVAYSIHPSTIPAAIETFTNFVKEDIERQKLMKQTLTILTFRHDMLKEITQ